MLEISSQNQLPIDNGEFESTDNNQFISWENQAINGGNANFEIETDNLIPGSSKALKSEIIALGDKNYDVSSKSEYGFEIIAGQKYTVSFYAKIESWEHSIVCFHNETMHRKYIRKLNDETTKIASHEEAEKKKKFIFKERIDYIAINFNLESFFMIEATVRHG